MPKQSPEPSVPWQREFTHLAMTRRRLLGRAVAAGGALAAATRGASTLAAPGVSSAIDQRAQSAGALRIFYPNFPVLDPQVVTNGMWFAAAALLEGLVTLGPSGTEAVPAAAEKWDVSADGKTYTFTLRSDAVWSNGEPVTAQDFEWTYKRLLTPQGAGTGVTLGANSYQPILRIVGAVDYQSGILTDWSKVGIKATSAQQLEFQLENPNAEFPLLLVHPSMLPMNPKAVEAKPKDWQLPGNWVGNGPFSPTAWTVNTSMTITANDKYRDHANVGLKTVQARLYEGVLDTAAVSYESGEVDIVGLPLADLIRYEADPTLSKQVMSVTGGTVAYLAVLRSKNPILENVKVRQALAMGLDREAIAKTSPATKPGAQLVPDSLKGWDKADNIPFNPDQAKKLLGDAGYPDGKGFPEMKILCSSTNPQMEAMADIWGKTLNIKVKLDVVEAGVYVERRWQVQEENYIGFYFGTYGSTPTWSTWAANLWGPEFTQQFSMKAADWAAYQKIQNDTSLKPAEKTKQLDDYLAAHASKEAISYGDTVDKAFQSTDPAEQQSLLRQAAKIRQETYLFIPVLYIGNFYAVKPTVKGIHLLPGGLPYYFKSITNG